MSYGKRRPLICAHLQQQYKEARATREFDLARSIQKDAYGNFLCWWAKPRAPLKKGYKWRRGVRGVEGVPMPLHERIERDWQLHLQRVEHTVKRFKTAAKQAKKGACHWAKNALEDGYVQMRQAREKHGFSPEINRRLGRYSVNAMRAYEKNCLGEEDWILTPHWGERKKRWRRY